MSGKIVAVVDDEAFIVEMITLYLGLKGYTVHGVYSGTEGLILVKTEKPDVLLLDLMMPDIEGFDVTAQLRAMPEFAKLPIVIISARVDSESRQRAMKAGANVYLTKPLKMAEVVAEIERVLALAASSPEPPKDQLPEQVSPPEPPKDQLPEQVSPPPEPPKERLPEQVSPSPEPPKDQLPEQASERPPEPPR